jgi:hypothetical protein
VADVTEDRRPRLLSERCATCVFHNDNRMRLGAGRLRELVRGNLEAGAFLICHDTLSYGRFPEYGEAMCRGFWDAYRPQVNLGRVMDRLSRGEQWWREVPPPGAEEGS